MRARTRLAVTGIVLPDRLERLDDVRGGDVVNGQIAERWVGVLLQALRPLGAVLGIRPAVFMRCDAALGAFPERDRTLRCCTLSQPIAGNLSSGRQRVDAVEQLQPQCLCPLSRASKIDRVGGWTDTEIVASSIQFIAKDPAAVDAVRVRPVAGDLQVKIAAVRQHQSLAIGWRLGMRNLSRREPLKCPLHVPSALLPMPSDVVIAGRC